MREKVKLLSTAGTGHFYVATKNKRLHPDKMKVKKYDPVVRKHVDLQGIEDQVMRAGRAQKRRPLKKGPSVIRRALFFSHSLIQRLWVRRLSKRQPALTAVEVGAAAGNRNALGRA